MKPTAKTRAQYFFEQVAEIRFSRSLHQWLTQQIDLFPPSVNLFFVDQIFDLACDFGFWVRDVAAIYPHKEVVGLDDDAEMIACAQGLTPSTLKGAQFIKDNIMDSIFCGPCVDMVHARFLVPLLAPDEWAEMLPQWVKLCRPGGLFVWTEAHLETTSIAWNTLYTQLQQAMSVKSLHQSAAYDITPLMDILLAETRCQQVERVVREFDLCWGSPLRVQLREHSAELISILQPLLTTKQTAGIMQIDSLCQEALIDLQDESIQGKFSLVTAIGRLPRNELRDAEISH